MQTSIPEIVKEALKVKSDVFSKLVNNVAYLTRGENGNIGRFNVSGRLIRLKPLGEALVVGDLHGDLESLIDITEKSSIVHRLKQIEDTFLIFLGDYGDRGLYSVEIYYTVLSLKLLFREQVVLMRGNHEGPKDLIAEPHDLPMQFQERFGENWAEAYNDVQRLFECMYNAILVEGRYLLVHGGLSPDMRSLEDLAYAHTKHPKQRLLEDMLWSDPDETIEEACASPRGAGKLFGQSVTKSILKKLGARILVRGHEPCQNGFKIDHDGKVLTLFSRKGPPYFNAHGAYLDTKLSDEFEHAEQLTPYIHRF